MRRSVLLAALVVAGVSASAGSAAEARWFRSPTGNIACEVGYQRGGGLGTYAFCVTYRPARCVRLRANGSMLIRRGDVCIGNSPENTFTLHYGRSVRVGPFRCTSRRNGMLCIVVRTRRGFLISREGIRRV